jgi:NAD(P)-dependent dehydrogenase (short-subunit alcohol dehydrogenase family)
LLFVNAGVSNDPSQLITQVSKEDFCHLMVVNAYCPFQAIEQLEAKVKPAGTIAVMSSSLGSIGGNTEGGHEAYRASKAALNSLMRSYAVRAGGQRTLLLMMPGWVKTEMGGPNAPLDVETSVRGLADTLARHQGKPGLSFVDYLDETLPW